MSERPANDATLAAARRALLAKLLDDEGVAPEGDAITRRAADAPMPLSFGQQRLWFLDRVAPDRAAYNVATQLRLPEPVDPDALARALDELVDRHEVLRTTFVSEGGRPAAQLHRALPMALPMVDLRRLEEPERRAEAGRLASAETKRQFDLAHGPLLRALLLRLDDRERVVLLTLHHIVCDGWSLPILERELAALYRAFAAGQPSPLPPLPIQYADYAAWQRRRVSGDLLDREIAHWQRQLAGIAPLNLPTDRPRPVESTWRGGYVLCSVDADLTARLQALSQREGATLFMTLLAAFQILLARYSGQDDIAVGAPVAGRTRAELEPLIGFFVNTLVLRVDLSGNPTVREALARVRRAALDAYAHQDVPFEKLVEELAPQRELGRNPLVDVTFQLFQQQAMGGAPSAPAPEAPAVAMDHDSAKFDLNMMLASTGQGLVGGVEYSADLFERATIERLLAHYRMLLAAMAADPDGRIADLPLLPPTERRTLLDDWAGAAPDYPRDAALGQLLAEQAARTPDAIAVECGERRLRYDDLDQQANRLARHLRALGVRPGTTVGVLLDRSVELVVALAAIAKAGGAYVPLDPAYPDERLAFMLADTAVAVLIARRDLAARFPNHQAALVTFPLADGALADQAATPPSEAATPDDLAYIMYTSGSTGRPKGVAVPQRAIIRLVRGADYARFAADDVFLLHSPLAFDASTLEVWGPLLNGGRLVVAPPGPLGPAELGALIERSGVTTLWLTAALFQRMVEGQATRLRGVRQLLAGGDVLPPAVVAQALRALPGTAVINGYGPTENTTFTCCCRLSEPPDSGAPVPIGRPIANTRVYVLDARLRPAPIGVPGELYAAGDGLARGYLNQPRLTAERFIPDPFSARPGARMYRTGDRARWREDGVVEFLGRLDGQVKLRGYRIELGEIEAVLGEQPGVRACAVVLREDRPGDKRLAAYVVADPAARDAEALRRALRQRLPAYMAPSAFVWLDRLPLSAHGKLDRKALPAPASTEEAAANGAPQPAAPRGELQATIAGVWAAVLGLKRVDPRSNFFDLGGHSLALMQVQDQLQAALGREIPILDLFRYPTVAELARCLAGAAEDASPEPAAQTLPIARPHGQAVAVIGMAGRFPGAPDLAAYWRNLREGVESIRTFTDEELAAAGVPAALRQNPAHVPAGGVLDGADQFDAGFFGLNPREADTMDPQHRLFLETAWAALEDAGYPPASAPGPVGVFAGAGTNDYRSLVAADPALLATVGAYQVQLGATQDHLATRTAYKLDLRGPAVTVQTACSTSLVAVVMACQSLLAGHCRMALAGGVAVAVPQHAGYLFQEGGILSPDGHCRAFDADARGTVPGSGVGAVVLKRLDDALVDGDIIHAVIRGAAINNDGAGKVGYTAPSVHGQAEVIAAALAQAGIPPAAIGYVEAHGTGTPLGDPIELAALRQVFAAAEPAACALGSVKTNVGHLDAAAGVAGLIKAVLALKHGEIPPSLHLVAPNPKLELASSPFFIPTQVVRWPEGEAPRRAGVSSFGVGGTNAHIVLEEAPAAAVTAPTRPAQALLLSAKTAAALGRAATALADHFEQSPGVNLADVAYTLQVGREHFAHRLAVVCDTAQEAVAQLRTPALPTAVATPDAAVVFLFPGQGAQHVGMARGAYEGDPAFREALDACADALAPALGLDLRQALYAEGDSAAADALQRTELAQPALFAVEYALARMWMAHGVRPAAMLGHSLGEYVAACLAGVFSLEDGLALVAVRGRLMQRTAAGAMLAVSLSEQALQPLLGDELALAAVNGPAACVVAGPTAATAALASRLAAERVATVRLPTAQAFHSPLVDPILAELAAAVARARPRPPRLPYLSNVTGGWITAEEATDPGYWVRHARQPVRFAAGLHAALREPNRVLLEVGPGQTLRRLARAACPEGAAPVCVATLPRPNGRETDQAALARARADLWRAGVALDWAAVHQPERRRRVSLPTYAFERERHWVSAPAAAQPPARLARNPDLEDWFYLPTWAQAVPAAWRSGVASQEGPKTWLLFRDACGLGDRLAAKLRQAGHRVATATAGDGFEQGTDDSFVIDPRDPAHYSALLRAQRAGSGLPDVLVHLWGVTSAEGAQEWGAVEGALDQGFYSLLFLAQALDQQAAGRPAHLCIVTSGVQAVTGQEAIAPAKAATLGPFRVIPKEYANLTCGHVDIAMPDDARLLERLTDDLLAECLAPEHAAPVAFRHGQRWVQRYERATPPRGAAPRLRQGGAYLITGGFGGIGLALADFLARTVQAKLVLVGRTGLPERARWESLLAEGVDGAQSERVRAVLALEALGAEVVVAQADVADGAALSRIVGEAVARFGGIAGVIHAAGAPGEGIIQRKTREAAARVLAPKVQGTLALAAALRGQPLDFLLLCSSLSAVAGGAGDIDYAAANAFLDAYALSAAARGEGGVIAVNWDSWREVGMAARASLPAEYQPAVAAAVGEGLSTAEGVAVFQRLLAAPAPQVAVSTRDLARRLAPPEERATADSPSVTDGLAARHARPELAAAYVAPETPVERTIAELWQTLLGIERVGRHDNFLDLGGHSLLAVQFTAQLRDALHVAVPLQALFDAPTVAGLAAAIEEQEQNGAEDAGDIARLLDLVEQLPPDQVRVLLSQEADQQ